jgi:hypothetical protein
MHSGFLPDDDWETEYEALKSGDPAYLEKLAEYLKYFRGRTAVPVSAYGPQVDKERAWKVFKDALGISGEIAEGDQVRLTPEGLPPIEGVVDLVSPDFLGVRTSDGMYRFIHGMGAGHHPMAVPRAPAAQGSSPTRQPAFRELARRADRTAPPRLRERMSRTGGVGPQRGGRGCARGVS